jgi:ribosomal protein S6
VSVDEREWYQQQRDRLEDVVRALNAEQVLCEQMGDEDLAWAIRRAADAAYGCLERVALLAGSKQPEALFRA